MAERAPARAPTRTSGPTEAFVAALAPHVAGGVAQARRIARDLPHSLHLGRLPSQPNPNPGMARAVAPHLPPALQTLDLCGSGLGPEGATAVAAHLPRALRTLILRRNMLGDTGAFALFPRLPPTLHRLDLPRNAIGAEGATAIATHLPPLGRGAWDIQKVDYNHPVWVRGGVLVPVPSNM